jgi:hypothetical protein
MIKLQAFLFPFLQLQLLLLHALVPVQVILDDHLLHQLKQCRLLGTQDGHSVDKAPELFWLMQFTHNLCVHESLCLVLESLYVIQNFRAVKAMLFELSF